MYWEDPLVAFLPNMMRTCSQNVILRGRLMYNQGQLKDQNFYFIWQTRGEKSPPPKFQSVVTGISGMSSNITPVCLLQKYRYNKFNRISMHAIMNDKVTDNKKLYTKPKTARPPKN